MEVQGRKIWQVAAGDTNRAYPDICLRWGVILNGPGWMGPWPGCKEDLRREVASRKFTDIQRFFEQMKDGDLVVLRLGTGEVHGVGLVVGDEPGWSEAFSDVDGWTIEFLRRVRWLWKCDQDNERGEPKRFPSYILKLGDTVQEMTSEIVARWIASLSIEESRLPKELPKLPAAEETTRVDVTEIGEYLFDQGIAAAAVDDLLDEMGELVRVAKWYQRSATIPSEHETVAYLAVPLLKSLGWTPQRMAIEWNDVDIALFGRLPRRNESLVVCVEAKRRNQSCLTAAGQAASYAKASGREQCRRIIVTDGIRYGVYLRAEEGNFSRYPTAYVNLTEMRGKYPIYGSVGAREALLYMAAEWREGATTQLVASQSYPESV